MISGTDCFYCSIFTRLSNCSQDRQPSIFGTQAAAKWIQFCVCPKRRDCVQLLEDDWLASRKGLGSKFFIQLIFGLGASQSGKSGCGFTVIFFISLLIIKCAHAVPYCES